MTPKETQAYQNEVDKNYDSFTQLNDDFYRHNYGRYALMKNQKVIQLFSTRQDARKTAKLLYGDQPFSIQKVDKRETDLGFRSYAII